MSAIKQISGRRQSLWLDNINRELLARGTLQCYIDKFSISGVTTNPTILERALAQSDTYDETIIKMEFDGISEEALMVAITLDDVIHAADIFRGLHEQTAGQEGWVSIEVSPLADRDIETIVKAAVGLHERASRPNLMIKIPGTQSGLAAIEEVVFVGIPVNVTLLFSRQHYLAASQAYLRALERRLAAGLNVDITSVASLFVSRWDVAANPEVPAGLRNKLGITMAMHTYAAYRELLASPRWQRLVQAGARPQRLLWASTGTKEAALAETYYVEALALPGTINTLPEKTLLALSRSPSFVSSPQVAGDAISAELEAFRRAGVDVAALAAQLQLGGLRSFEDSWTGLLSLVGSRRNAIKRRAQARL